jgi:hypothetical protein
MGKCDKCDKESTTHVTEVNRDTGEVKQFELCDEHSQDQSLSNDEPSIDTTCADSPMTDPVELAALFVADLERGGYAICVEGETVTVTRSSTAIPIRIDAKTLRQAVAEWLASKGIFRKADQIKTVVEALLGKG